MKVLFQHISRYQDSVPNSKVLEVEGDSLTKANVQKMMEDYFDDDTDFTSGDISKSKKCWCIWGEEEDTIITVLD